MVNSILKQTLVDGARNLVIHVFITGDGSGDETATLLVDVSTFGGAPGSVKLNYFSSDLTGFSANLLWDATTDVPFLDLIEGYAYGEYRPTGGLINNSGTGKTGDILITTTGLGSGDKGHLTLEMVKK